MYGFLCGSLFLFHWSTCLLLCQYHAGSYDSLKSGMVIPQDVLLLFRVVFSYLGLFVFPYKIEYCPFKVCEELCWNFDGTCIESIDCF